MKRKTKKLSKRKRWIEKKSKSSSILPVLFAIGFLSLFSETIRTVPAGAKSENFRNLSFELPSLSSDIFEQKYIKKNLMVDKQSKNYDFLIEENFTIDKELIVAIDSDQRVKFLKGKNRPINSQNDRKLMLESLRFIDRVIVFNTETELKNLIKSINPDIMVVGSDYKNKKVIGSEYSKKLLFFERIILLNMVSIL